MIPMLEWPLAGKKVMAQFVGDDPTKHRLHLFASASGAPHDAPTEDVDVARAPLGATPSAVRDSRRRKRNVSVRTCDNSTTVSARLPSREPLVFLPSAAQTTDTPMLGVYVLEASSFAGVLRSRWVRSRCHQRPQRGLVPRPLQRWQPRQRPTTIAALAPVVLRPSCPAPPRV